MLITVVVFLCLLLYFVFFRPEVRKIRKIQSLINKDRSVCDFIQALPDWNIGPGETNKDGLVVLVDPVVMPIYKLIITYKGNRPTSAQIKILHSELTNKNSIVQKAHKINVTVEEFMNKSISNMDINESMRLKIPILNYIEYVEADKKICNLYRKFGVDSSNSTHIVDEIIQKLPNMNEWRIFMNDQLKKQHQSMTDQINKLRSM